MQTRMIVNTKDISYNIQILKHHIRVPIIAVVKMNGYGINIENAVDVWYQHDVRFFAVDEPSEVYKVFDCGYKDIYILLMSPVYNKKMLINLIKRNVILTVVSKENAIAVSEAAKEAGRQARVQIQIDTGMGCFGLSHKKTDELMDIYTTDELIFDGIYSHFPYAFEKEYKHTKRQLEDFQKIISWLKEMKINYGFAHIANSCAAIRFKETWLDAVRIGSGLLGRLPCKVELPLTKIGFLEAEVVDIKTIHKGETAGYAQLYTAKKDIKAALLMIGRITGHGVAYQNDYLRFSHMLRGIKDVFKARKNTLSVDFQGKKLKIIGRMGQQYTLFNINNVDIRIGDIVTTDANPLMTDALIERVIVNSY